MTPNLDLAQAAALHRRAVDAGMEGIIHPEYEILDPAEAGSDGWRLWFHPRDRKCLCVSVGADTAAVTHWLREFNKKHTNIHEMHDFDCTDGLVALAERIITRREYRNANPA